MRVLRLLLPLALAVAACSSSFSGIGRKDEVLYVALGASDAFGIGATPITNGYVYRIRRTLDEQIKTVHLINLGIPGAEIEPIRRSLDLFLETRAEPDLVTLWTGPNDVIAGRLVADFEPELDRILGRLRDDTDAFVVMANIPDMTQLPRFQAEPQATVTLARIRAFNEAIARVARRHDVPVVDLFAVPVEDELVSDADGFHPSNEGHRLIAQLFLDVIQPALGLAPRPVALAPLAE